MEAAASIPWATAEDWDAQQSTIAKLYVDEGKTLRELMDIMKRDHSFYAT